MLHLCLLLKPSYLVTSDLQAAVINLFGRLLPRATSVMSFFNRKPKPADVDTATAVGASDAPAPVPAPEKTGLRGLMARRGRQPAIEEKAPESNDNPNPRPKFGQWLKGAILDLIVMAVVGAVTLGVSISLILRQLNRGHPYASDHAVPSKDTGHYPSRYLSPNLTNFSTNHPPDPFRRPDAPPHLRSLPPKRQHHLPFPSLPPA